MPLETPIASGIKTSLSMSLWASLVVVGINLNGALYNILVLCIKWQYSVIYYTCNFIECENVHDVAWDLPYNTAKWQ